MANVRFGDQPARSALNGTEIIPFEDPSTNVDGSMTPVVITEFSRQTMALASGSNRGLMSGSSAGKLEALRTNDQNDALNTQLGQQSVPLFIGSLVDGEIEVFENLYTNPIEWDRMAFNLSSGSTVLTVKLDGVPVTGWQSINVTTTRAVATATGNKTMAPYQVLSVQAAASDTPVNLALTLKGNVVLE